MYAILKRELSSHFNTGTGYVVLAVYIFFSGIFLYSSCFSYTPGSASLAGVFGNMFFIILFLIPIITMKTFAEEKHQKTDQALLTSPTSLTGIVMGKFLGSFILYAICSVIYIIYGIIISFFTTPQWSVILCTLLGVLLLGAALIAINVFVSVLTESMVVAAVVGMGIGLLLFLLTSQIENIKIEWIAFALSKIDFMTYYTNFTYGIISIVDVVFYLTVAALFLFLTVRVLEKRRWS